VVAALGELAPGGRLVINAIRKADADRDELLKLSYAEHLWMEREVKSVANVTRADVAATLELAASTGLRPEVREVPLEAANAALAAIRGGDIRGATVLRVA
jgi:propanol-preferring alcohol dehydrogenase